MPAERSTTNVYKFINSGFGAEHKDDGEGSTGARIDRSGGGGDDGGMEARVSRLETLAEKTGERLTSIDTRLSQMGAKAEAYATKSDVEVLRADLHRMDASIKTWMIGTVVGLMVGFGGLFLTTILRLPGPSAQGAQPVIVNIPPQAAQAPALPASN
jgi:hypothetical protein